ncbi:MAG TPA: Rid family hydrolase [Thermoanaerobaculia bacterium]|jgi:2-aminophenol/2-amino-5-chlorophenol 1,6-dioxygenase alpha subunit
MTQSSILNPQSSILKAYIVPGQPHILLGDKKNAGWAKLKAAYEQIGREIEQSGAELILLYSTQWFSVIGHLFQIDPRPKWTLVDQNWYELGEIPYEFRVDPGFGELYARICKDAGMQAATVAYHGFPIDTGTVVALKLMTPNNAVPASMVSCNIYAEREETRALGFAARKAIEAYGKKTIVVAVTNFSNRYEVAEIDPAQDRISSQKDDEWNRKLLEMFAEGRLEDVAQVARDFAREANADMGFKAIWWLGAVMGEHNRYDGKVWEYQPVWGTGSAIVELTPNDRKQIDWEKEFDEGPVPDFSGAGGSSGTGLETHNVLENGPNVHQQSEMSSQEELGAGGQAGTQSGEPRTQNAERRTQNAETLPPIRPIGPIGPIGSTATNQAIRTDRAPKPVGPYPHARRVGDFLFLSGIGPRKPVTGEIPGLLRDAAGSVLGHDIEVQTRACIENIRIILEEAGSSLEKVLDVTVYLTDMQGDFERFNKVYAEYFGQIQPTRTTVGVDSLPTPIAVELKVIASA